MKRVDPERIMAPLKNFQRRTVDYVFRRMYLDDDYTRRFLVADEAGLGKTMVARGLIAKTIDHLYDDTKRRIDIIYVCSNGNIARQNINRLNILDTQDFVLPSRITLLPIKIRELNRNKVNFISLTPSTSFDLKSSLGLSDERVLLYHMLQEAWSLSIERCLDLFRGGAGSESFRRKLRDFDPASIDSELWNKFMRALQPQAHRLCHELESMCDAFQSSSSDGISENLSGRQNIFIGELRSTLAYVCVDALEPDLIILDEFQRFGHLLDTNFEDDSLASVLFNFESASTQNRILLLSATPYKMYTLSRESDDNHYADFLRTIGFLLHNDQDRLGRVRSALKELRDGLLNGTSSLSDSVAAKDVLETELRRVMARTERLAVTIDRNGMLRHKDAPNHALTQTDLRSYLAYEKIAEQIGDANMIDYWKSAPFLLNFMQGYRYKRLFTSQVGGDEQGDLVAVLTSTPSIIFPRAEYEAYAEIDPGNANLRTLKAITIDKGLWQLLWLPPSLPYYQLDGPFRSVGPSVTKQLVFSNWQVVPRTIASFLSYEAERLIHSDKQRPGANTPDARIRFSAPLRFSTQSGNPASMSLLSLVYPSIRLAELGDPLGFFREAMAKEQVIPNAETILSTLADRFEQYDLPRLSRKHARTSDGPVDERWYWAAPLLLDLEWHSVETRDWMNFRSLASEWSSSGGKDTSTDEEDTQSGWESHVARFRTLMRSDERLGAMPVDLARVLALMAVASPAVIALRSLTRLIPGERALRSRNIRMAAGQIAHAFLSLFRSPEATALLRNLENSGAVPSATAKPYWRSVLDYSLFGCLQAVMDEYLHVQYESLGLYLRSEIEVAHGISDSLQEVLRVRTASPSVDDIQVINNGDHPEILIDSQFRTRNHFAMRFGTERSESSATEMRAESVRLSFNSPFWPFVLATTSIGQEGLDFHPYCHSVVHWNLPSNPVDLEQREGRIHRYKGHAVRKNVAMAHAEEALQDFEFSDPWQELFDVAARNSDSEMSPYWVYMIPDGAQIESIVPSFPLSREEALHADLRRSLAVYRLAFGQPRQEDLVAFLREHAPETGPHTVADIFRVNLEPPAAPIKTE